MGARARLADFRFSRSQAGLYCADVSLDGGGHSPWQGRAHGACGATGELRASAEATLHALEAGTGRRLELLGVKSLRAFDATVVIVAIATDRHGEATRLMGCALAGDDGNRGAVLATLDATNRVLNA